MFVRCVNTVIGAGVIDNKFDRTKEHEKLLRQCLLELSTYGYLVWNNRTGAVKTASNFFQRYGLKGSGDIIGCSPDGRFACFEIKTGSAVQNKHQKAFERAISKRNGVYLLIRSMDQLKEFLNEKP